MVDAHKNFAVSTVATAPSPATSGTSLVVASGEGTRFPAVPFNATIWPAGVTPTPNNAEIVRVTAITTDTLTITRTQEGTSARTVLIGDQIAATITVKTLTDVESPNNIDLVTDWTTTSPAVPSTGVTVFARQRAGRRMPAFIPPSGLDSALQPGLAFNKVAFASSPGINNTVPTVLGMQALTGVGTATARPVATTNFATQTKRTAYVSAATAGSATSIRTSQGGAYFISSTAKMGGFYYVCRFLNDTNASTADRMFVGLSSTTGALSATVEPSTYLNSIGVGFDGGDTNFQFMQNNGSGTATKTDLGANFAKATLTNVYELRMFSAPGSGEVSLSMDRLDIDGAVVERLSQTTKIPVANTLLTFQLMKSNNATAAATAFAFISVYIETDN